MVCNLRKGMRVKSNQLRISGTYTGFNNKGYGIRTKRGVLRVKSKPTNQ